MAERGRKATDEVVIVQPEHAEVRERGELAGDRAGESVILELDLAEFGKAAPDAAGDRAGETVVAQVQLREFRETAAEPARDRAGEAPAVEVELAEGGEGAQRVQRVQLALDVQIGEVDVRDREVRRGGAPRRRVLAEREQGLALRRGEGAARDVVPRAPRVGRARGGPARIVPDPGVQEVAEAAALELGFQSGQLTNLRGERARLGQGGGEEQRRRERDETEHREVRRCERGARAAGCGSAEEECARRELRAERFRVPVSRGNARAMETGGKNAAAAQSATRVRPPPVASDAPAERRRTRGEEAITGGREKTRAA